MFAGSGRYEYWPEESPELVKLVKRGDYAAARGAELEGHITAECQFDLLLLPLMTSCSHRKCYASALP